MVSFGADVSNGICYEPGFAETEGVGYGIRIADCLSAGNTMIKRNVLVNVGLFDMAYDHGQKADGDLGARIHRAGYLMLVNPDIRLLHHRAPSGGLRKHNVRKTTYASSRSKIAHFRLPHMTELYFNLKNLNPLQQREYLWHSTIGTFSLRGKIFKRIAKAAWALLNLPKNLMELKRRLKGAQQVYEKAGSDVFHKQIP
jgi:GT2 family glycosyltransferase